MPRVLLYSRQPLTSRPLQEWLDETADSVVLITTPKAVAEAEEILAAHFPRHRLVEDYHSWATEQAAEEAAREHGAELVASTSESDVLRAARLRARLGAPGQSVESATAYRDKLVMKRTARAAGLRVPSFAAVEGPMDLLDFIDAEGFPVVVKPRTGAAARGVSILRSPADVTAFLEGGRESAVSHVPGQWMVEGFARGDLFHVDGIMRDGRIIHAWPCEYTGGLAERVADGAPLGSVLLERDDARTEVLRQFAADVVAALPTAPDPLAFHLEAWIDPDGEPVLCEIASRAGGALIAEVYERAFGVQLAKEGLRAQCGSDLTLDHQPAAPAGLLGWLLLPIGHGTFVPPAESCPVPGVELEVKLAAGTRRDGVEHATDAAAEALVHAETAGEVRKRMAEVTNWWHANTAWQ
ncbi:ATP-grasp domain-containing protein [Streptomyces sp. SID2888]|uniref:ATP-grasp domain-containing protein n=1 Tax=Streptomyces sp. SID2888 TaxID=2690256 RepID=UPI001370D80A|nr:ATP-grasp domain-containing protein [Streptomyces sp. SID2888]MYV45652.1 ATP-grasp domain-containing protein [Streptomyces sp. SID2888]